MSRDLGPVRKKERRFNLLSETDAARSYRGLIHKRKSEFGIRLEEKQKIKFIYGVQERQFKRYMKMAFRDKSQTGVRLLQLLETRLDRVIFLAGLVKTMKMARQLVTHGHALINGKKVSIPSYSVAKDDVITLSPKLLENVHIKESLNEKKKEIPSWLKVKGPVVKVDRLPNREDIDPSLNEQLVVEYYSR